MTTILITGANRGLGLEHTRQALAAGESVIACCRDPQSATDLAVLAGEHPQRLAIEQLDVTDEASIEALAAKLTGRPIDILLNNAGIIGRSPWTPDAQDQTWHRMDYAQWARIMDTNLYAPLRMVAALHPNLLLGERRMIVMVTSDLASIERNTMGGSHAYRTSKAALNMLARGLAVDLADDAITVVALSPGWTQTDMGGSTAIWPVGESVANQRATLARLTREDSGRFLNLTGEELPW